MAEVVTPARRCKPKFVQRRLGVDDDRAAVWKLQFQQATGAHGINVDAIGLQPSVDARLDMCQYFGGHVKKLGIGKPAGRV